jgi:hypothetical protein
MPLESSLLAEACARLNRDAQRWIPEVERSIRTTLWFGILMKAVTEVERVYELAAESALAAAGDEGTEILARVANGKPVGRLTMGARMDLLKRLGTARLLGIPRKGINKKEAALLEELTKLRNNFVHRTLPPEEGPQATLRFLNCAKELCATNLIGHLSSHPRQGDYPPASTVGESSNLSG